VSPQGAAAHSDASRKEKVVSGTPAGEPLKDNHLKQNSNEIHSNTHIIDTVTTISIDRQITTNVYTTTEQTLWTLHTFEKVQKLFH
jgi:hypothetical protein